MGCFNATCAVSQIQIKKNEKVRLFFLYKQNQKESSHDILGPVHSDDLYAPFCLSILGKYDENGGIEAVQQDWSLDLVIKYFQKKYPKEKINTVDDILGWVINDPKNKIYTFALVKESVFQAMQSVPSNKKWLDSITASISGAYQDKNLFKTGDPELTKLFKQIKKLNFSSMELTNLVETLLWEAVYSHYFKNNKLNSKQLDKIRQDQHLHILMNDLGKIWVVQKSSSQESKIKIQKQFYTKMLSLFK